MIPAILSGGSGTRLWPVSRASHPKQFCDLFDESLILKTVRRLQPLGTPWVITTQSMRTLTERLFRDLALPQDQILCEPMGRNTAAAVALLCHVLELRGKASEVVGIFPADHFVENTELFQTALRLAEKKAIEGAVVTLGIQPSYPATGYGYIELSRTAATASIEAIPALKFREKPDSATAKAYVESGKFSWNAGIFVFRADRMIALLKEHLPDVWNCIAEVKGDLSNLKDAYNQVHSISIDYGIMEKLENAFLCIPCQDLGWSDVGSWDEVAALKASAVTQTTEVEAKRNFVFPATPEKQYAFVGVDDLIVADTVDALLVMRKGTSQAVKDVQQTLAERKAPCATQHVFEYRPWGTFEVLRDTAQFKSKVIRVEPGQQLSYQSHAKRAEHWIVVSGQAEVVLNDVVHRLSAGQHIHIPQGAKHRMRNPGKDVVEFVEVQLGSYFGEDDIVRYQDDYQRT